MSLDPSAESLIGDVEHRARFECVALGEKRPCVDLTQLISELFGGGVCSAI